MCNNCVIELEVKEYINYQTGEALDLQRVNTLPDNAMLKVKPDLWCEWNFEKNEELGHDIWKMTKGMNHLIHWECPFGHNYKTKISHRTLGTNCKSCGKSRPKNIEDSLGFKSPQLVSEWHPSKNGKLTPHDVLPSSNKKVWWLCPVCNSSYDTSPLNRNPNGKLTNCPYCAGKRVNHTNSLASLNPELASQWHPTKNDDLTPNDVTCGSHKKVWWLGSCGHEWESGVAGRNAGTNCPYCANQKVWVGFNDMWTTNPELAKLLANPEDGYKYTQNSNLMVDWKCPCCGKIIKNKRINGMFNGGISCNRCSDGISYPEKFIANLLSELSVEYVTQKTFEWSNNRRYDFYIPHLNTIIEAHGEQHYQLSFIGKGGRTLEQEQANDKYKYELAIANGIKPENYIVIDCRMSKFYYIKNSIFNSKLNSILELKNIDWNSVNLKSTKSLILNVCESYLNENESTTYLMNKYNLSRQSIITYLKRGTEIGLINYKPVTNRHIVQLDINFSYLGEYDSLKSASEKLNIHSASITNALRGNTHTAGGFRWMYKEEYSIFLKEDKIQTVIKPRRYLKTNKVVQLDRNREFIAEWSNIAEASTNLNIKTSDIYRACTGLQKSSHGFIWLFKECYEKFLKGELDKSFSVSNAKRKIVQLDYNGKYIQEWESITLASNILGIPYNSISSSCKKVDRMVGGYIFVYLEYYQTMLKEKINSSIPIEPKNKKKGRRDVRGVVQLGLNNEFIKEWDSINDAAKYLNIKKGVIYAVCKGTKFTYKGYKWVYKEDYDKYMKEHRSGVEKSTPFIMQ